MSDIKMYSSPAGLFGTKTTPLMLPNYLFAIRLWKDSNWRYFEPELPLSSKYFKNLYQTESAMVSLPRIFARNESSHGEYNI